MVNGEPLVGDAVTFWNAPEVTMAGEIGIDVERATRVPRHHLVRLAREGERLSLSHLRGLSVTRRRGILVATMLELGPRLRGAHQASRVPVRFGWADPA